MFPSQPVVTSQLGTVNNIIQVKKTDFEVFDALMVDSQKCSDMSGECWSLFFKLALYSNPLVQSQKYLKYIFLGVVTLHMDYKISVWVNINVVILAEMLLWRLSSDLSSSPPGPYHQDAYVPKQEEKFKSPPILPPHLLQVILNKDTGISVST